MKIILQAGCQAPSGDNAQPWRFRIRGESIDIINTHNLDHPFFNFRQRGTYVAHGAVIENMLQQAVSLGYLGGVSFFPDPRDIDLVARIIFSKTNPATDTLVPYIAERHTNRKPHTKQILTPNQEQLLLSTKDDHTSVHLLTDQQKIKNLGGPTCLDSDCGYRRRDDGC